MIICLKAVTDLGMKSRYVTCGLDSEKKIQGSASPKKRLNLNNPGPASSSGISLFIRWKKLPHHLYVCGGKEKTRHNKAETMPTALL